MVSNVFELPHIARVGADLSPEIEARLRRLAVQIAAQLPEDPAEARRTLALTVILLENFLARSTPF